MSVPKICYLVAMLLAVVGAFVPIPYAAALLAVLGAVASFSVLPEHHVRVLASALVLHASANAYDAVPALGPHLTAILGNAGVAVAGAAVAIIVRNMIDRAKA
jgi:hypothetical protein